MDEVESADDDLLRSFESAEDLDEFIHSFYSSDAPGAKDAIKLYLNEAGLLLEANLAAINHFFATIIRADQDLLRACEGLLGEVSETGFNTLLELLRQGGDETTRKVLESHCDDTNAWERKAPIRHVLDGSIPAYQSMLERPVRSPADLDLLWAEFFGTGDRAIVLKIIEVLGWDDVVRSRMQEWLHTEGETQWPILRRRRLRKLSEAAGIVFDADWKRLENVDDLDTRCFLRGVRFGRSRSIEVRRLLPFELSDEEMNHVAVKVSAKWSLAENAGRHPVVMEVCIEQAREVTTPVRLSLLEIQAAAHLMNMDTEEALAPLDEYLQIDPSNRAVVRQRRNAASGVVRSPPSEPASESITARLQHPAVILLVITVLVMLSSPVRPVFASALSGAPVLSTASAIVCFVLAVLLGVGQQTSDLVYRRALVLDFDVIAASEDGKWSDETLLGCWNAPIAVGGNLVSAPGCLWMVTGILSLWPAGVAATFLARSLTPREVVFAFVLCLMLVLRWAVSAVASRIVVWRWASSLKSRDPTP